MTSTDIDAEYAAIVDGLSPAEIQALWMSALFGHRATGGKLAERVRALSALRDRVGKQSAARHDFRTPLRAARIMRAMKGPCP